MTTKQPTFQEELTYLINRHSLEDQSHTPDFLLAEFLNKCLEAWNLSVTNRDQWYRFKCR